MVWPVPCNASRKTPCSLQPMPSFRSLLWTVCRVLSSFRFTFSCEPWPWSLLIGHSSKGCTRRPQGNLPLCAPCSISASSSDALCMNDEIEGNETAERKEERGEREYRDDMMWSCGVQAPVKSRHRALAGQGAAEVRRCFWSLLAPPFGRGQNDDQEELQTGLWFWILDMVVTNPKSWAISSLKLRLSAKNQRKPISICIQDRAASINAAKLYVSMCVSSTVSATRSCGLFVVAARCPCLRLSSRPPGIAPAPGQRCRGNTFAGGERKRERERETKSHTQKPANSNEININHNAVAICWANP